MWLNYNIKFSILKVQFEIGISVAKSKNVKIVQSTTKKMTFQKNFLMAVTAVKDLVLNSEEFYNQKKEPALLHPSAKPFITDKHLQQAMAGSGWQKTENVENNEAK